MANHIGERLPRREDRELLTGAARTVADLTVPGTVELAFVRAGVASASIRLVDAAPARSGPPGAGPAAADPAGVGVGSVGVPRPGAAGVGAAGAPVATAGTAGRGPAGVGPAGAPVATAGTAGRGSAGVGSAGVGVVGAWAAADLPGLPAIPVPPGGREAQAGLDRPALATDRVRYAGEPVAVVAAGRRAEAEDAAELVRVELDPLPVAVTPAAALAPDAPRLFAGRDDNVALTHDAGKAAEDVFAAAAVLVEGRYRQQLLLPTSLEPRALLVRPDADGGVTVWVSHQAPFRLREALAGAFGLDQRQVRVVVPATGGAFGAKSQVYPEYVVAVHLARLLGRPVRWVEDRAEAMLAGPRGRGQDQRTRLAADADGRFLGYELLIDADIGAYPHTGAFVPTMTAAMSTGAYRTPRVHARVRAVLTNTAPTSSYRGAGRPEAAYALERTVDRLARRLGIDPAELRRRNFLRPEDFPYRTPTGRTYDSGNYAAALDLALSTVDYPALRTEQAERRRTGGPPLGVGIATYVERSGGPPDSFEYGSVELHADGTVVARSGSTSTGQGHLTAFAQVVASALDIAAEPVRVVQSDTREVPDGFATYGSRSMQVGGGALWRAARGALTEARGRFAAECGVAAADVRYSAGVLSAAGRSATLAEVAARTGPVCVEERFTPPQAFPFGAYVAVVEIDPGLGTVRVRRLVAVDDYGVVVNPLIVDGQGYGSITQGLGQALYERAGYGPDGTPRQATLLDYLLPTIAELPPVDLRETQTPNPNNPFGAKGAGEAGCIGVPPAIVNAVCDALDLDHLDMPLTPDVVWQALRHRRPDLVPG